MSVRPCIVNGERLPDAGADQSIDGRPAGQLIGQVSRADSSIGFEIRDHLDSADGFQRSLARDGRAAAARNESIESGLGTPLKLVSIGVVLHAHIKTESGWSSPSSRGFAAASGDFAGTSGNYGRLMIQLSERYLSCTSGPSKQHERAERDEQESDAGSSGQKTVF